MQDVDMEPAEPPEPYDPSGERKKILDAVIASITNLKNTAIKAIKEGKNESIKAIKDAEKESIKAVKNAQKVSTVLSYRMLIAGAVFGFLGSFFVATLLRWHDAGFVIDIYNDDFLLGIAGPVAFFISGYLVYSSLKKVEQSKK